MNIRKIEPKDYPKILPWFESREWPLPPIENGAPDFGFVCERDGKPSACAFLYLTGRAVAYLDWIGADPSLPPHQAMADLNEVIDEVKRISKASNPPIKCLIYFTKNEKLKKKFEKMKFKSDKGYSRLMWTQM